MTLASQKLHIVELKEARKLEEAKRRFVNALSFGIVATMGTGILGILAILR